MPPPVLDGVADDIVDPIVDVGKFEDDDPVVGIVDEEFDDPVVSTASLYAASRRSFLSKSF